MHTRYLLSKNNAFLLGCLGAGLMYLGDLLMFGSLRSDDISLAGMVVTMADMPTMALYLGGAIGPIAGFFLCCGFYGLVQGITAPKSAKILLALFCLCYLYGGACHSHYPYLPNLIGKQTDFTYLTIMTLASALPMVCASIFFIYLVLKGQSLYPKRIIFFSPLALIMLSPLWELLPPYLKTIIGGGWNNLLILIFFMAARFHSRSPEVSHE